MLHANLGDDETKFVGEDKMLIKKINIVENPILVEINIMMLNSA